MELKNDECPLPRLETPGCFPALIQHSSFVHPLRNSRPNDGVDSDDEDANHEAVDTGQGDNTPDVMYGGGVDGGAPVEGTVVAAAAGDDNDSTVGVLVAYENGVPDEDCTCSVGVGVVMALK